jgi:endonuclease-3
MEVLEKAYPEAKVALEFSNPLEMLVATVLSAQCTDVMVNKVTRDLFRKYTSPQAYADAPEDVLEKDIHSTGFFNQKAKRLRGIGRAIIDEHDGKVPDTMEGLVSLPGVARKTANIVLGNSFGKVEGMAVDTHVRRLAYRMGLSKEQDPVKIERDLMDLLPRELWFRGSYILINHGRSICNARRPLCEECPVTDICPRKGVK